VSSHDPVLDASDTASYVLLDQTVAPAGTTGATLTYPNDRHLRRVFSTTVNIRNRRSL
jgi:type IV pilus assembly protein PilW